jgi:hypothetical protein
MHRRYRGNVNKRRIHWLLTRKQSEISLEVPVQKRDRGCKESTVVREQTHGDSSRDMSNKYVDRKEERRAKYSKKKASKKVKSVKSSKKIKQEELDLEEYKNIIKDLK